MLEITRHLIEVLNHNNVVYCNWKGTSKIEDGLNGKSDIDILVSKESARFVEDLLKKEGFVRAKTQWLFRFKEFYDWIGFDNETGKLIHLHLHYRMIAGHPNTMEYSLPWESSVLKDRIKLDNDVYTVSPEWELLIFLYRIGLEYPNKKIDRNKKELKVEAQQELEYLQKRVDWEHFSKLIKKEIKKESEVILNISQQPILCETDFLTLKRVTAKNLKGKYYNVLYKYLSSIKGIWNKILVKYFSTLYWLPQKKTLRNGLVVAFLGQDGSGKSTVTQEVEKWLNWKLEVKRFYLGSGEEYYNPWRRRLLKALNKQQSPPVRIIRYWLYFSYLLESSRYVLKTVKNANRYATNGGIALLDRYPQVEFEGINDGPKIRVTLLKKVPRGLKWLGEMYAKREERNLRRAVNMSPALVYKLILSPEESLRRKPFENREMVERKHEIIKALKFPSSEVYTINAEQNYEQEIIQIKQILWRKIQG